MQILHKRLRCTAQPATTQGALKRRQRNHGHDRNDGDCHHELNEGQASCTALHLTQHVELVSALLELAADDVTFNPLTVTENVLHVVSLVWDPAAVAVTV